MMGCQQGRTLIFLALISLAWITGEALPFITKEGIPDFASKAVTEAADIFVQKAGWKKDSLKISSVDMKDAKLGETVTYEFDIEIGGVVLPIFLREEISAWRFLEDVVGVNEEGSGQAVNVWQPEFVPSTLKPFQLAGPVDLWIQDADKLRLAMPNDVDAGVLKRILIADGASVTVEGAREVSLTRPLKLPLPLLRSSDNDDLASTLLNLASRLRLASSSEDKPLSMRIVGPSTLIASSVENPETTKAGLKVRRISPSAVELVSREIFPVEPQDSSLSVPWLWPLASLNGSSPMLIDLERALFAFLGPKAYKQGSVTLLNAKAKVASFVKISFQLESPVTNETTNMEGWPEWSPKPSVERMQFELLAKVEDGKLRPMTVNQVPYGGLPTVSVSWGEMTGNQTVNGSPFLGLIDPMSLDYNWGDVV
ncbi:unnamed protein product [Calypogeia fissa]